MKPLKRIALLAGLVSGIVLLWLVPGINTAKQTRYVRTWEDTDAKTTPVALRDTTRTLVYQPEAPKKYKKEIIEDEAKLENIKAEMFSRATHFKEEELVIEIQEVPLAVEDSVAAPLGQMDSLHIARLDSLRR